MLDQKISATGLFGWAVDLFGERTDFGDAMLACDDGYIWVCGLIDLGYGFMDLDELFEKRSLAGAPGSLDENWYWGGECALDHLFSHGLNLRLDRPRRSRTL